MTLTRVSVREASIDPEIRIVTDVPDDEETPRLAGADGPEDNDAPEDGDALDIPTGIEAWHAREMARSRLPPATPSPHPAEHGTGEAVGIEAWHQRENARSRLPPGSGGAR